MRGKWCDKDLSLFCQEEAGCEGCEIAQKEDSNMETARDILVGFGLYLLNDGRDPSVVNMNQRDIEEEADRFLAQNPSHLRTLEARYPEALETGKKIRRITKCARCQVDLETISYCEPDWEGYYARHPEKFRPPLCKPCWEKADKERIEQ